MADSRFVYSTFIRTTPEKLWNALIDPEFTRRYWMELVQESEWKPGSSWKALIPGGTTLVSGEIIEIDPPKKLILTWQSHKSPEVAAEGHARLTYEIQKLEQSVRLTVIHEIALPNSKVIASVSGGWPIILASLKSLLETGEPLPETTRWVACK